MGRDWPTDTLGEKIVYYALVLPLLLIWRAIQWLAGWKKEDE